MKIIINADAKEIAALVLLLQERQISAEDVKRKITEEVVAASKCLNILR
jgi:hypothetical protein